MNLERYSGCLYENKDLVQFLLHILATKFESGKRYTEKDINQILKEWHTFDDWAVLRRALYDARILGREKNGSTYWLEDTQPTLESFGFTL